ncbi:MAG: hypothetical protein IPK53_11125 [bacterium]|nr:hypothetical protein [bacterium]
MTIDQLTQYLNQLQQAMPTLEQRYREAEANINMQRGAIEAVRRILADAQAQAAQQAEEEHEHIHN